MNQSGWPIEAEDISKYHLKASAILQVEGTIGEEPIAESKSNLLRFTRGVAKRRNVRDSFYESMKTNPNIDLFLNANLVHINLTETLDKVRGLSVASYAFDNPAIEVHGGNYVLAMGAIENI